MSMSTFIKGVLDDDQYFKMKGIYDACKDAKISIPDEVLEYFGDIGPSGGKVVDIPFEESRYNGDSECFTVDLKKLDKKITKIIFTNSW